MKKSFEDVHLNVEFLLNFNCLTMKFHNCHHVNLGVPHPLDCAEDQEHEQVFIKNTFDGFLGTGLHEFLQSQNVKTLIVMGLITRACVLNTVMSAFNNGYRHRISDYNQNLEF